MTDTTTLSDLAPGEEVDEHADPPPGFNLDGEAGRPDAVVPGIVERDVDLEPDEDDVQAVTTHDADGVAEDDDEIDDPDEAGPVTDDV